MSTFSKCWTYLKTHTWVKYVITLLVFAFIYLFVGDQSLVQYMKRSREIEHLEKEIDIYRQKSEAELKQYQTLQEKEECERFGREKYLMHEQNEDIYLVEEE